MYTTLLFDLDDTLLDFKAAEKQALRSLFQELQLPLTQTIQQRYATLNTGLWQEYELGKITRGTLLKTRFTRLFRQLGQKIDGVACEKRYRTYLSGGHALVPHASEVCGILKQNFHLEVATNGIAKMQLRRLADSGLANYFERVFVSEEAGFQKPQPGFFNYIAQELPYFDKDKTLIIGDSLTSDITGGNRFGIDTCWFNPNLLTNQTSITPTFQIRQLPDLVKLLEQ
ncbi:YjjG family noncanonical pyrimidine nucleotidase [Loigolactobacillus backii]|uniref:HAD family hydrolase n=1 Tax=Loigolactobacillus backii TaxID=375175 RepID=A0A192H345_9LACO|nr:YjjG family noncanonical pyrimidine nucleotidase [Loigolactobacillus backii]ANK59234.1 HAD family hydrolase [Loigolactobacillus backii]ANK62647.1 HAD family hydrolase [Loigolactobacillus backii]ANK64225.1 HAD family hydrolase [Loigolactobacillus backii]ANK67380.1 HAD family hydrolase [Loigolactobacillus backii]ANK70345.1 HAD family hydrolase [Loigolactobacillus backii]